MELVSWGARFHREPDGRLTQRVFGAHTFRRTVFYGDWTGKEIVRVLMEQVNQRKIKMIDSVCIMKLSKSDSNGDEGGAVNGALGIDIENKGFVRFECKSLILAAGGYTRAYPVSSSRLFEN